MRILAEFIMRGRMQATLVAATCLMLSLLLPLLSLLAAATVALVTLRQGWREGLNTLLASALAAGLLGAIVLGNFALPVGYGLMLWLPTWGIAQVLRLTRNLGWTFELAAALGLIGVTLAYLFSPDMAEFWQERMQQAFGSVGVDPAHWQARVSVAARYLTGIIATGMLASLGLSLLLARWWQALLYNPGGFRAEFLGLRLHKPMAYLTFALGGMGLILEAQAREAIVNLLLVLTMLYLIAGTATLHALFASRNQKIWLFGLYGLMLFVPHILLPIALVGLSDTWLNWRDRFGSREKQI
ncbi:MAG: hypothetical protein N3A55_05755 [Methylohalobius sp.]|nr:hypothetical protein [Methylohalobius sp.]